MDFNTYQIFAVNATSQPLPSRILFLALELTANQVKKIYQDNEGNVSVEHRKKIEKELGDLLSNIATFCTVLGINLDDVACQNIEMLISRKQQGV